MNLDADIRHRRLLIAAIVGGLALVVLVGAGLYGLVTGPVAATAPRSPPSSSADPGPRPETPAEIGPVSPSSEPEVFARRAAVALFTWSTTVGQPAEYAQPLIDLADDREVAMLVADIFAYLPGQEAWTELRTHQTQQWLTIDAVAVPRQWSVAQGQALPGQIPRGAAAYTIDGTRHRFGFWGTQTLHTERPVAFTVFVVCPPLGAESGDGSCRLLRLSRPNDPLR